MTSREGLMTSREQLLMSHDGIVLRGVMSRFFAEGKEEEGFASWTVMLLSGRLKCIIIACRCAKPELMSLNEIVRIIILNLKFKVNIRGTILVDQ